MRYVLLAVFRLDVYVRSRVVLLPLLASEAPKSSSSHLKYNLSNNNSSSAALPYGCDSVDGRWLGSQDRKA